MMIYIEMRDFFLPFFAFKLMMLTFYLISLFVKQILKISYMIC